MADPFIAEIRIFPFGFAPSGWAFCDGQLLSTSQNVALFSLLSTTYGGDGNHTFALPNLQGRAAMQPGQGPDLSNWELGNTAGESDVTLLQFEMPSHTHALSTSARPSDNIAPADLAPGNGNAIYAAPGAANRVDMHSAVVGSAGGNQPHNNMQPYLTLNFCIALQGVFPPHS